MSGTVRSVPLAEAKAQARALQEEIVSHKSQCQSCGKAVCAERALMNSALRQLRRGIASWWKPPPGTPTLF